MKIKFIMKIKQIELFLCYTYNHFGRRHSSGTVYRRPCYLILKSLRHEYINRQ